MADHRILWNAAWQLLGNPLKYAASARPEADRTAYLLFHLTIRLRSVHLPRYPPPTMVVGNHILAWLQIACKTISSKCESSVEEWMVEERERERERKKGREKDREKERNRKELLSIAIDWSWLPYVERQLIINDLP